MNVSNSAISGILFLVLCGSLTEAAAMNHKKVCSCEKVSKAMAILSASKNQSPADMAWIPAGTFMMGGNDPEMKEDELPQHPVKLSGFYMDITEVTNQEFAKFVANTHYVTTAEQPVNWDELKKQLPPNTPKPSAETLAPGSLVFMPPNHPIPLNKPNQWWKWVNGANWRHPLGANSRVFGNDHPVVHVSWYDANAYCKAMGKRLPTEAEREWASRGGLNNKPFPWGDEHVDTGKRKANTWQGNFPNQNTLDDHYYWTSPVKAFPPNGYGLYDMAGNVWQWTADLYDANYFAALKTKGLAINPKGSQKYDDPDEVGVKKYVLRGGSFLCNKSYCSGYRVSSRMRSSPDSSLINVGFRCAKDRAIIDS